MADIQEKYNQSYDEFNKTGKKLPPKGLGCYNVTSNCSVTFKDTFAFSKAEAETLAKESFFDATGNSVEFKATLQTDNRTEVQQLYEKCWNKSPIAEPIVKRF